MNWLVSEWCESEKKEKQIDQLIGERLPVDKVRVYASCHYASA